MMKLTGNKSHFQRCQIFRKGDLGWTLSGSGSFFSGKERAMTVTREGVRQFYFFLLNNGQQSTGKMYRNILENLLPQDLPLGDITSQDVMARLNKMEISLSTKNTKLGCLRSFLRWCHENNFLEKVPTLPKPVKTPQKEAAYLSKHEISKLRSVIKANPRDNLLFSFYLNTGARLSEIANLNIGDVKGKKSTLILGKGRKPRTLFLNQILTDLVKNSVNGDPAESPLFCSYRGERLTSCGIQGLFQKYLAKAGIKRKLGVHSLRHTFATAVYTKTKDLRLTQELLGHSSPVTTARYAHVSDTSKQKAIQGLYSWK